MTDLVAKLWGFCHTLRHDGIDYGDYIEQITYLLFLKMAEEKGIDLRRIELRDEKGRVSHHDCSWPTLRDQSGSSLLDHYIEVLRVLGKSRGLLGDIYSGAQSRFNNAVNLKKLVSLVDEVEWTSLEVDVKAAAYEGLLEKAAAEGKKGAGQYFTPRLLIQSIVRCMKPDPRTANDFTICDPAVGTGGFLVAAYEWLVAESGGALERDVAQRVKKRTYFGQELVQRPRRLALMNLYLHGIEPHIRLGDAIYEQPGSERFDVVLTNPPFGTKGANQAPEREDFTIATSNKQLNFLQHVMNLLKPGGRAAVVLPDNCLFADQAGEVMEILTKDCQLHTVLRLPRGTFTPYSPSGDTNVVFFTKGYATTEVWIYDARTNVPSVTKRDRPLASAHFAEFEACYGADPNGRAMRAARDSRAGRWRRFHISEVEEQQFKLDVFKWLKEEGGDLNGLPEPESLIREFIEDLEQAQRQLTEVLDIIDEQHGMPESVGDLPEGWLEVPLTDVTVDVPNASPEREPERAFGYIDISAIDNTLFEVNLAAIKHFQGRDAPSRARRPVQTSDVLFSNVRTYLRNVALVREGTPAQLCSTGFTVLRSSAALEPEYLLRWVLSDAFVNALTPAQTGTHYPATSDAVVRARPIRLPPIAEQRRIAVELEKIFHRLGSAGGGVSAASQRSEAIWQAILVRAFDGGLVPTEAELSRSEGRDYESASALLERIRAERAGRQTDKERSPRRPSQGKRAHEVAGDMKAVSRGNLRRQR